MDLNILMVDDHPPIIEGYKAILSFNKSGHVLKTVMAYSCEAAYIILTETIKPIVFDMVFLDITLPPFEAQNIHSGEDLVQLVKKHQPQSKIVILTSHTDTVLLQRILNQCKPNGLLVKSDFLSEEFLLAFDTILEGGNYYSATILNLQHNPPLEAQLDIFNRQILHFLAQGIKTKNLYQHIHLSTSAIEKRKAIIKEYFGIKKGTDEDILREARKQGLL
jgi:two-component system response regulator NreC